MVCVLLLCASFFLAEAQVTTTAPQMTQEEKDRNDPVILMEKEYNFGEIPQGKPVYHIFQFQNKGSVPLKLEDVHASCGCTTPEWSRDPVAPGATASIKVGYNAAAEGPFDKYITINYNTSLSKQIRIVGTVWKAPEGPAPVNASVQLLKKQTF